MNGRRLSWLAALAVGAAMALLSPGAFGGARAARSRTVTLKSFRFHPGTLSISRGDSVTWLWRDPGAGTGSGTEHNVTFQRFHSRTQTGGSYTVRFTRAGSFAYRCTIHAAEGMKGRIIVR
jgi:plastocyanin